ncbi:MULTISPECIES: hypothetical protein [unclassified Microbacterium]|uniref:hypothetical protein n=1 Tax=unclassified Microbacterium TaxID=2609290 RepID=UPI000EA9B030|nr:MULTISPECIES: hypothetical protein [unclassified Microbacterium]MBT2484765.1 hypothetical protein [Microbacterium sp. ISL-108]RKN67641.1 hypothetical protein D7252_08635 [Microbacterium sp. CGR2]
MSAIAISHGHRVGDTVFVGPAADLTQKTTWKILSFQQAADDVAYATVTSGLTGMIRTFPVEKLTAFMPVERVMEPA